MLFVYGDLFVIVLSNDTRTQKIHACIVITNQQIEEPGKETAPT
jgi:hypothetical protein